MVMQDAVTAWDLKPNRENTNKIFNVLCNVQPVEHPWSGDGYARKIDVTTGSKDQYWFEKCKGLKKCKLYEYECESRKDPDTGEYHDYVTYVVPEDAESEDEQASSKKRRNAALWSNSNFTDVIVFKGYRIYMRKNNLIVNPYGRTEKSENGKVYVDGHGDGNANTCDHVDKDGNIWSDRKRPTERLEYLPVDKTITDPDKKNDSSDQIVNQFNTAGRIRIYIQQVDTDSCTGDTFDSADEAPIVLVKEYEAAECNPDHFIMGYGGIGAPLTLDEAKIYTILYGGEPFAYLKFNEDSRFIAETDSLYIPSLGIYITGLQKPDNTMESILSEVGVELGGYIIPQTSELLSVGLKMPDEEKIGEEGGDYEENSVGTIYSYAEYGEIPYFAAGNKLHAIHGFFALKDGEGCNIPGEDEDLGDLIAKGRDREDATNCQLNPVDYQKKRLFIYDTVVNAATNKYTITGLSKWGARIAYVAADGNLFVSGNGTFNGVFGKDPTASITEGKGDYVRGAHLLPAGVTDVKTLGSSLLFLGPKVIFATASEQTLALGSFVSGTDNEDGYYSHGSYHNDDGEFLLVRRGKVLGTLQVQVSYTNSISISFDPSTGFYVNSHFKSLNNDIDKINVDADINYRYVSIYDDNNVGEHYSKLLIYDKHYNCWYWWMITGARVIRVKDGIYLGDGVYVNKGRTWGWKTNDTEGGEIIEIISAYVGEEGLQTPKHIQYIKTAIGDHSVITKDSLRDIDTSYGGRLYRRRNNITATRYPTLLSLKNRENIIETYEIGEEIYGHGKLLSHNLLNEISEYRNYDKFSNTIIREMGEESDMISELALFASIKEPINAPANVLELCISARHLDNVQFGSFYIGYYQLDADYEDIANTNIDVSDASDQTEEIETVINRGEYCDEILDGSACDVPPED